MTKQRGNNFLAKFTFMKVLTFPRCEFNDAFGKIQQPLVFDVIHMSDRRLVCLVYISVAKAEFFNEWSYQKFNARLDCRIRAVASLPNHL